MPTPTVSPGFGVPGGAHVAGAGSFGAADGDVARVAEDGASVSIPIGEGRRGASGT